MIKSYESSLEAYKDKWVVSFYMKIISSFKLKDILHLPLIKCRRVHYGKHADNFELQLFDVNVSYEEF